MVRGVLNRSVPLVGCSALPFIDQGGAEITDGRKKKNQRPRRSFEGASSSLSKLLQKDIQIIETILIFMMKVRLADF